MQVLFVVCERLMELAHRRSFREHSQHNSVDIMRETAPSAFNNRRSHQGSLYKDTRIASSSQHLAVSRDLKGSRGTSRSMENIVDSKYRTTQHKTSQDSTDSATLNGYNNNRYFILHIMSNFPMSLFNILSRAKGAGSPVNCQSAGQRRDTVQKSLRSASTTGKI